MLSEARELGASPTSSRSGLLSPVVPQLVATTNHLGRLSSHALHIRVHALRVQGTCILLHSAPSTGGLTASIFGDACCSSQAGSVVSTGIHSYVFRSYRLPSVMSFPGSGRDAPLSPVFVWNTQREVL